MCVKCCFGERKLNVNMCGAKPVPHGGVLVRGEQAVAGLHASHSHRCSLSWLTGHKHWLLVRLLWHRNLLQKKNTDLQHRSRSFLKKVCDTRKNTNRYLFSELDNWTLRVLRALVLCFILGTHVIITIPDKTALEGTGPSCLASGCPYCFAGCQ